MISEWPVFGYTCSCIPTESSWKSDTRSFLAFMAGHNVGWDVFTYGKNQFQTGGSLRTAKPQILQLLRRYGGATSTPYKLTVVVKKGVASAGGTVTTTPAGIHCSAGSTCAGNFEWGQVNLTASPTSTSKFGGWQGACSAAGTTPTCNVMMDQAQS